MKEDKDYLPDHYKPVEEPAYHGAGNHSVAELEKICQDYKEYVHQQRIIKQEMRKELADLKRQTK